MIHPVNSVNPGHSDSDNYGFRIDMSPGTTVCSNLASETGPYPNTSVNASMQIGDPFEFHGNCAPSTFKLNTMNNSTARGLYMGGMPMGGAVNGTIIGDQGASGIPHDNTWSNISGFHTDFNNVLAANNIHTIKKKLVYPIDSAAVDTLITLVSSITPNNNIESNYKEVFELVPEMPERKDSCLQYSGNPA